MSPGYPCPNPTCSHVFPPAALGNATSLTCPKCGNIFQFRAGPSTPAQPAGKPRAANPKPVPSTNPAVPPAQKPLAKSVPVSTTTPAPRHAPVMAKARPAVPAAPSRPTPPAAPAPLAPPVHFIPEFVPPPDDTPVKSGTTKTSRYAGKKKKKQGGGGWVRFVVLMFFILGGIGGTAGLAWWLIKSGAPVLPNIDLIGGGSATALPFTSKQFNYRFTFPTETWQKDDRTGFDVKANLAFRRAEPTAWMALIARDYKTRTPRQNEAFEQGIKWMDDYFEDVDRGDIVDDKLGGQPAQKFVFQGTVRKTNARTSGEAVVMAYKGVGYLVLTWAPEEAVAAAQKDFEGIRQRFAIAPERDGWQEKRPKAVDYVGTNADYVLRDTEAIWKPQKAADYDDVADQAFLAYEREQVGVFDERKEDPQIDLAGKSASFVVLNLGAAATLEAAMTDAVKHLEDRQKKDFPETDLGKPLSDKPERFGPNGDVPGRVAMFHVKSSKDRERFVLLGVVSRSEGVIVLQGECDWNSREKKGRWEGDFQQLLKNFRIEKRAGKPADDQMNGDKKPDDKKSMDKMSK